MNEQDALMSEVKQILDSASSKDRDDYREYIVSVAKAIEQTLHDEYGKTEAYELWCLNLAHRGTGESVEEYRKSREHEEIRSLDIKPDDAEINSCIEMSPGYMAQHVNLQDLNALLDAQPLMMMLHFRNETELVGLVARTGAWLSGDPKCERPSLDDNKQSITATIYMAAGHMVFMSRNDDTGVLMEESIMAVPIFVPESEGDAETMVECAKHLDGSVGRTAAKLYAAWAFPRMMRITDMDMAEALNQDALLSFGSKENQQETADNPQENSNDN